MKTLSVLIFLIAFSYCANAFHVTLTPEVPGKSIALKQEGTPPLENRALNKNNEQQLLREGVDANEFKESVGFTEKGREKRSGYYWHENRYRKKKFRPSPLIWG